MAMTVHATAGTPTASPAQGKKLSFDVVVSEPSRASPQNSTPVLGRTESRSGVAAKPAVNREVAASGAAAIVDRSTATADGTHGISVAVNTAGQVPTLEAVPTADPESPQCIPHSLNEATLETTSSQPLHGSTSKLQLSSTEAIPSQSLEGSVSKQQLISLEASPRQSLEGGASNRQLNSLHSMQNETTHDGSRKRVVRHSLSGKIVSPSAASATSSTYSSRYATRQLSGKASPASTDGALSPRRSLLASPVASIHAGLPVAVQQPTKPGSGRPAIAVRGDERPAATLAGAAAVLKSHTRPSAIDGAGWHLATGDGLPFSPRGSLVASSGGSRTLRPIASQQEALFDAEGNMLPRSEWQPLQAEADPVAPRSTAGAQAAPKDKQKLQFQADLHPSPGPDSKSTLINAETIDADTAGTGGLPAKQKIPAKHGMLSMVMRPCFCLRPRTTSAEDPYPQGSLRQRFAGKEVARTQPALDSKGVPVPRSALKQKQPSEQTASDMGAPDWDLGTEVHRADAADAADVQLSEAAVPEEGAQDGRSLQGAISLAPRLAGLATGPPHQSSLQQVSEVIPWPTSCRRYSLQKRMQCGHVIVS